MAHLRITLKKAGTKVLVMHAEGVADSGSWSNARLVPFAYGKPPADGIYEFEFVAEEVLSKRSNAAGADVAAVYEWPGFPPGLRGVKVYALDNSVTQMR